MYLEHHFTSAPDEGRPGSFQQLLGNPWYRLTDIPEFFLCQLRNHALGPLNGSCLESSLPSGDRSYDYLHSREVAQRGRGHIAQGHRAIKLRSCDLNPGSSYIRHYSFFLPWLLSVVDKMHFPNLNRFYKRDRQDISLWLTFLILCHTRHIPTLRPLHCLSLHSLPPDFPPAGFFTSAQLRWPPLLSISLPLWLNMPLTPLTTLSCFLCSAHHHWNLTDIVNGSVLESENLPVLFIPYSWVPNTGSSI